MFSNLICTLLATFCLCESQLRCHPGGPLDAAKDPMTTPHDCTAALRALANGDYTKWHGLTDDCTTAEAVAAFGAQEGADRTGDLGGSPTRYRIYPATAAAPHGIYVWDVNDRLVLIRIHDVTATRPALEQLGEPEARDVSKMPGFKTQWIYAVRGLTLHIDDDTGATAFLYAYPPMTLAEFRASWLSRVEIRRIPMQ
jgi:hypothetical protein